ncbi:MAG: PLP-dependent aminotransferase family protein [Synergistales bacterium]|nr:PLP-dependent aminotransferase family protein [Synergistales bacterium]
MIEMPLDRGTKTPLYLQISLHLKRMIESGALENGSKLPSTRDLAFNLGVSRTTILQAYDQLDLEGLILQRGRSGAYVCFRKTEKEHPAEHCPDLLDMKTGLPSNDLIPCSVLSRLCREILLEKGEEVLGKSPLHGVPELRRTLVTHAVTRGIPARREEVLLTSGGREGLSLSMAALMETGVKNIWLDELTYPDAFSIARNQSLLLRKLPWDQEGMSSILRYLSSEDALYLVPSFQNPTGRTLPQELRQKILENSISRGYWIIEDDAYGELRYGAFSVPAMKAMKGSDRVIYLGSFSQALFPGLRLGYSLMPLSLWHMAHDLQTKRSGPVSSLVQYLVLEFIQRGYLRDSLDMARATIQSRMEALAEYLNEYLPDCSFQLPAGGIYLWIEIPGLDGDEAERLALARGVEVSSGNDFSWEGNKVQAVRLSVSTLGRSELGLAVKLLSQAWESYYN